MYTKRLTPADLDSGNWLTVDEFVKLTADGIFVDEEGYAHPCLGDLMDESVHLYPSKVFAIPNTATHVMWFGG